jgi:hypothetical protein
MIFKKFLLFIVNTHINIPVSNARPVFIVPGLGGSVLHHAKELVWPPTLWNIFTPEKVINNLEVSYNHTSNQFYSKNKLETSSIIPFYNKLKSKFTNAHEVPYDFRLVGNKDYRLELYKDLSERIEKEVEKSNSKSTIITHSMAGLMIHDYLLTFCSEKWKKKYIHKLITVNTPYAGTVVSLKSIHDKQIKYPLTNTKIDLKFVQYVGGLLWTLPNYYYLEEKKIYKNYSISQIKELLTFLDNEETFCILNKHFDQNFQDIKKSTGVTTLIIYSRGEPTLSHFGWNEEEIVDGDGTVPLESLTLLKKFNHKNVFFKEFDGHHVNLLACKDVLNYISKEALM